LAQDKHYIQWQQEDLERRQSGNSYVPPEQRKWYGSVEHAVSTAAATGSGTGVETAGQLLAQRWLESSASPEGPKRSHLWLLPEQPKRAAAYVQSGYRSDMHALPPPLDWLEPIIDATYWDLRGNAAYEAAQVALRELLSHTRTAEHLLEAGLRRIQEKYEGGPPLV
jgi:hypothetical protein